MHPDGCRIAVIGAGFSGVMTAIHLLWRCKPGERVYLVERSGRVGPGLAYSTGHQRHLVNVRAENMSAFADEPGHFAHWLDRLEPAGHADAGERTIAGTFVRRSIYGRYIQDLLREAIARQDGADNLYLVADQATALRPAGSRLQLETASGRCYPIDAAVLATGNYAPVRPALPGYVADPWSEAATAPLEPGLPVVLLGTALTMADVCLTLVDKGFAGPIHAISRRGLLPQAHAPSSPWPDLRLCADDRRSLLTLFRAVRREVRRAAGQSVGWRAVVDALRPHVQTLWAEMTTADQARFLRHVRPYWDVHRHRMAPPVAATLAMLRAAAMLEVHAGRITSIAPAGDVLRVRWRPRGEVGEQQLLAQRVIDCTGLAGDYTRIDDPLVQQLLADGLVRPAALALGLDCTTYGAMIDARGEPSRQLFGVGPVTRGALFEITAVPEIRAQAEQVAANVLTLARSRFAAAA
ncbi:FAD/NAD(P)-binding protein [Benzoatithermus flavus]|uniref:FAD/NAD(P)-binding protein n=1 Tax=Benzoatithermus flavus TaxID=3108223 RepID=A0ABU8XVN0_9PROT